MQVEVLPRFRIMCEVTSVEGSTLGCIEWKALPCLKLYLEVYCVALQNLHTRRTIRQRKPCTQVDSLLSTGFL